MAFDDVDHHAATGFTLMFGFLPRVSLRTRAWTAGMRVDPPTRRTSSISFADGFAHRLLDRAHAALDQLGGEIVDVDRMIVMVRCLGPLASAVTNGRFTCYSLRLLSWRSSTARSATSTSATMSKWFG